MGVQDRMAPQAKVRVLVMRGLRVTQLKGVAFPSEDMMLPSNRL